MALVDRIQLKSKMGILPLDAAVDLSFLQFGPSIRR